MQRCIDGRSIIAGKEASLKLSDRIPAVNFRQSRVIPQMVFESKFIKSLIVERAKFWGQSTKRPDKSELRGELVNNETELNLLGKPEAILGFTFHLSQLISCC